MNILLYIKLVLLKYMNQTNHTKNTKGNHQNLCISKIIELHIAEIRVKTQKKILNYYLFFLLVILSVNS